MCECVWIDHTNARKDTLRRAHRYLKLFALSFPLHLVLSYRILCLLPQAFGPLHLLVLFIRPSFCQASKHSIEHISIKPSVPHRQDTRKKKATIAMQQVEQYREKVSRKGKEQGRRRYAEQGWYVQ